MVLALTAVFPRAQEVLWTRTGVWGQLRLGGPIAALGDVNGDGFDDIATSIGRYGDQLLILSGRDGSTLRVCPPYSPSHGHQALVAAGDTDGDGVGDYATTLVDLTGFDVARVHVCSGLDDHVIYEVTHSTQFQSDGFGQSLAGNLDLDGDQRPDLVISAWYDRPRGAVYTYLHGGRRQHLIREPDLALGPVAGVGDVDRDGLDDFVVGAGHLDYLGRARVYSGRTGALLVQGIGELPYDNIGDAVTGCGDLDADGVPEFAASSIPFLVGRLVTRVFSGRTGQALYTWADKGAFEFGGPIDFDQDGVPDVVCGAPYVHPSLPGRPGRVYVFSGRDGSLLHEQLPSMDGPSNAPLLGYCIVSMRPQPGSPFPLYVVTETGFLDWTGNEVGRIHLVRGSPRTVGGYGTACSGTLATAPRIGMRTLAGGIRIHLSGAQPGAPALLLLGLSSTSLGGVPLPLDLGSAGFPGCSLLNSADLAVMVMIGTHGIGAGYGYCDLPLPLPQTGTGSFSLHGQWLGLGSGPTWPGGMSAGLRWRH